MPVQIVTKDGKGYCRTTVPYTSEEIKSMKKHGYKVKTISEDEPKGRKRG